MSLITADKFPCTDIYPPTLGLTQLLIQAVPGDGTTVAMVSLLFLFSFASVVLGGTIIYDGRAPLTLNSAALDGSLGPYLT